jgi:hypothetical protein
MSGTCSKPESEEMRKVYRKKGELVCRDIAGETFLIPVMGDLADMQNIFTINPSANMIWQMLDGKMRLDEILERILADFDVEEAKARSDMMDFIGELIGEGLIEEAA